MAQLFLLKELNKPPGDVISEVVQKVNFVHSNLLGLENRSAIGRELKFHMLMLLL
jgi:hypothetical protein